MLFCALIVLTFASAFCSSSETAFFSLSLSRIRLWRESQDYRQRLVAKLLAQSRHLLVLIFMLNTVVNIFIQNVSSDLCGSITGGWLLRVALPLLLILVVGEFLPKYFGMMCGETLALKTAPLFSFLERLFSPVQRFITTVAETLSRVMFFFLKPTPPLVAEELEEIITTCEIKGVLSEEEASLIRHSIDFENKEARELMIPRSEMPIIKRSAFSKDACIEKIRESGPQTLLVVDETIDRPIGAIGNREALLFRTQSDEAVLAASSSKIFFVPEAMPAKKLLHEFCQRRASFACVTDEHGSISGFIEANDLAKTLLGFPTNRSSSLSVIGRNKTNSIIVPGATSLSEINDFFDTDLSSEYHSATIGGWLTEMFDGVPPSGTSYTSQGLNFRVLLADDKVVKQLFIEKKTEGSRPSREGVE